MIKKILVSQPKPKGRSPYSDLEEKYGIKVDFMKFFGIEGIDAKEFRKSKVKIEDFDGIIFTSRTAIDHFFRITEELKTTIPNTMKYYCINEQVALYLQKYTIYRKRKVSYGNGTNDSLIEILSKNKDEKLLLPMSEGHKSTLYNTLKKNKFKITKAEIYRTVSVDLKNIDIKQYDLVVLFSPWGVKALLDNFPDFKETGVMVAAFGNETNKALKKVDIKPEIKAPTKKSPSMPAAIEEYIEKLIAEKANA